MPSLSIKERKAKFNTDDLIFRKKSNLPFETLLSLSSYVDFEYSSAESLTNKYKLFRTKSKQTINSLAPSKKYIMVEEFKDKLRDLKNILNEIKKLEPLREQENNKMKNETKRKLNMFDEETNKILEKLDENLTTLELRCIFCGKPYDFKKRKRLRLSAKVKINKIERLKGEVENNEDELLDYLLDGETKVSKLLTDLKYEKI